METNVSFSRLVKIEISSATTFGKLKSFNDLTKISNSFSSFSNRLTDPAKRITDIIARKLQS
jgi:hypothetical protein